MRAHVLTKYGKTNAVLAFHERPQPALGAGEVRIDVEAVALNPVDLKTREGEPKMLLPFSPPFVLGSDLAGKVLEVGSDVKELRVGDAVYAYAGMDRMGAFAETVVLPADRVARRPGQASALEAACLPLPGLCALQALDAGNVDKSSRVLVAPDAELPLELERGEAGRVRRDEVRGPEPLGQWRQRAVQDGAALAAPSP